MARQKLSGVDPDANLPVGPSCADLNVYRVRGYAGRSRARALAHAIIFA
jgi:hypothetical protein